MCFIGEAIWPDFLSRSAHPRGGRGAAAPRFHRGSISLWPQSPPYSLPASHLNPPQIFLRTATFNPQKMMMMMMMSYSVFVHRAVFAPTT